MTNEEIRVECEKHIGKTYPFDGGCYYRHGYSKELKVTSVEVGYYGVNVLNSLTFEDGFTSAPDTYTMDGRQFLSWITGKFIN
jgi:hypothetical protein